MRTYILCVRENKITWIGFVLLTVDFLGLWQYGWSFHEHPVIVFLVFVGAFLVGWTALSTTSACTRAYREIEQREGKLERSLIYVWQHSLPCYAAGFRVAVRKWNDDHPDQRLDISHT